MSHLNLNCNCLFSFRSFRPFLPVFYYIRMNEWWTRTFFKGLLRYPKYNVNQVSFKPNQRHLKISFHVIKNQSKYYQLEVIGMWLKFYPQTCNPNHVTLNINQHFQILPMPSSRINRQKIPANP